MVGTLTNETGIKTEDMSRMLGDMVMLRPDVEFRLEESQQGLEDNNEEGVLGKLLASLLEVLVMLAAAAPLFMLITLFGGISFAQVARVFLVTLTTALAAAASANLLST